MESIPDQPRGHCVLAQTCSFIQNPIHFIRKLMDLVHVRTKLIEFIVHAQRELGLSTHFIDNTLKSTGDTMLKLGLVAYCNINADLLWIFY